MKQGFLVLGHCHPATLALPAGTWAGVSRLHPLLLFPQPLAQAHSGFPSPPPPHPFPSAGELAFPHPCLTPRLTDQLPGTSPASPGLSLSFPCSALTCPPAHCLLSGRISFSPLLPPQGISLKARPFCEGYSDLMGFLGTPS